MDTIEEIIKGIEAAKRTFTGWNWTQDFRGNDNEIYYASGIAEAEEFEDPGAKAAAMEYGRKATNTAKHAASHADTAIRALQEGDIERALNEIDMAIGYENEWGDCPSYGPIGECLENMFDEGEKI